MKEKIEAILRKYPDARANTPFKGPHQISELFRELKSQVSGLGCIEGNPNLIVKSSYGKGNWATVPWLAIMDTRVTSSTQDGTYIVFLFDENGEECQLKLAQGVTQLHKTLGSNAEDELKKRANHIRSLFPTMLDKGFEGGDASALKDSSSKLARLYDSSSIFSKRYPIGGVPEDGAIKSDISELVDVYEKFVVQNLVESDSVTSEANPDSQRIWAIAAGEAGLLWPKFLEEGLVSIGWDELGDLRTYSSQEAIISAMQEEYGGDARPTNNSLCCYQFANEIRVGDLVVAKTGRKRILGVGRVTSDYKHDESRSEHKNIRAVSWEWTGEAEFPGTGTTIKTLTDVTPYQSFVSTIHNLLGIETDVIDSEENTEGHIKSYSVDDILAEGCFLDMLALEEILKTLQDKRNVVLQGPPGTGKSWLAKRLGYALMGKKDPGRMRIVQFHSNLAYEDFVRGFRPNSEGKLSLVDGPFMEAIEDAKNTSLPYVFVIEEINRGNPAQIFGEMLTLLENTKRSSDEALELTYRRSSNEKVYIPDNFYVIGTMNIADRSLALLDLALRRRFAFINLEPSFSDSWRDWLKNRCGFPAEVVSDIEYRITALNAEIASDESLGSQFKVGHSYLTPDPDADIKDPRQWFRRIISTEIGPLLEEYWFDDSAKALKQKKALLENF